MNSFHSSILRTLLYYDIFDHPLTTEEIFRFLPVNSVSLEEVELAVQELVVRAIVSESGGFYFVRAKPVSLGQQRLQKQVYARKLWRIARMVSQLLKRFPFVRAVLISGDLSKNVADENSDIDFFLITEKRRLWICRAFLVLFKKTFLFNRRKYFCINHYITEDHLEFPERNVYTASEIAHLKPTYNEDLYYRFLDANNWIRSFFPNFEWQRNGSSRHGHDRSALRTLLEVPFRGKWADKLDDTLMNLMMKVWKKRYPELTPGERDKMYRCRPYESRAQGGNFEIRILRAYEERLRSSGIMESSSSFSHT